MGAALDPSLARGTSWSPSGAARYEAHVLESLGRPGTCSAARAIVSVGLLLLKVCGTLVTSTAGTEPPTPPFPGAAEPPAKTVAWSLGAILPPEFTATVVSQPYLGLVSTPPPSTTPTLHRPCPLQDPGAASLLVLCGGVGDGGGGGNRVDVASRRGMGVEVLGDQRERGGCRCLYDLPPAASRPLKLAGSS